MINANDMKMELKRGYTVTENAFGHEVMIFDKKAANFIFYGSMEEGFRFAESNNLLRSETKRKKSCALTARERYIACERIYDLLKENGISSKMSPKGFFVTLKDKTDLFQNVMEKSKTSNDYIIKVNITNYRKLFYA